MSSVDKILKKVEQERSKGNDERALTRLKEAIAEHPREFVLSREAALLAFELGKPLEGVTVLRGAIRRCPAEHAEALSLARFEFDTSASAEVGELLYDSYLAQSDFDQAREVVVALKEPDQKTLLAKLGTRIESMHENVPEERRRLLGLLLAEAVACSAMKRSSDVAASLTRLLDLDNQQVEIVGRLCKTELRYAANNADIRLLLARSYILVQEPGLAAEQLLSRITEPEFRAQARTLLEAADQAVPLQHARGVVDLLDGDYDRACDTFRALLAEDPSAVATVRQTLDRVAEARKESPRIRLLFAETLARSEEITRSLKEIEAVFDGGKATEECLHVLDTLLELEGQETEVRRLRAKVALDMGQSTEAVDDLRRAIESGGTHARGLKSDIEAAFQQADCDPKLGSTLVDLYLEDDEPQKAADTLAKMHRLGQGSAAELFELAGKVAGKYGFTSGLVVLFAEVALDVSRPDDARAAMKHYLSSPGARVDDFTTSVTALVHRRGDLGEALAKTLGEFELSPELRVLLVRTRLEGGNVAAAVRDLEALVTADTRLTRQAQEILEEHVDEHDDSAEVLELLARFLADQRKVVQSAGLLARAIVADPACSDRACRQVNLLVRQDPSKHEVWRPVIQALMDVDRQRHARELCYQAAQHVAAAQQGFLHTALAQIHFESGQFESVIQEIQLASDCVDVPWDRLETVLRRVLERDPNLGYAQFLLGKALLVQGNAVGDALEVLQKAVTLDHVTRDMVLDLLQDHQDALREQPEALVLEGTLRLHKGDRRGGVTLLREAVQRAPQTGELVLRTLQAYWDQDPDDIDTGLALAQALLGADQLRRACRLLADLADRFPEHQAITIAQLQKVLEKKPISEAHKALWNIHLSNGERDKAIHHVQLALEDLTGEPDAYRSLLETAYRQVPESVWVTCRMAEVMLSEGNDERAEQVLRGLLEANLGAAEDVVRVIRPAVDTSLDLSLLLVDAHIASSDWMRALEALRALRKAFPGSDERTVERYRVLMDRGDTRLAAHVDFGMLLREAGHIEDATRVFEETLEQAGANGLAEREHEVRLALASLYADLGREVEGKELLSSVIEHADDPSEAYRFIEQVTRKTLVGKLKKLQDSIQQSPTNMRARLELARLSMVSGDFRSTREALSFTGDSPSVEATRLYLLARSYADEDQPQLAVAVLRSIVLDDVADDELRRNIVYLLAVCSEQLGHYGEAHARFLRLLSENPGFKDTHKRARDTYQKHLETSLEPRALVLEKRVSFEMS